MNLDFEPDDNELEAAHVPEKIKPQALKTGCRVGLIAAASRPESPLIFKRCMQVVEEMGFHPVAGKNVLANDGFCAGTDQERLDDFQTFLEDQSISGIFCCSGGYGALRLLPLLDFGQIREHPKVFLGSGDNDAILLAINKLTGLVVFHGSNLDEITDKDTFEALRRTLTAEGAPKQVYCRRPGDMPYEGVAYSLNPRNCSGDVCGGNLTALSSLFGTRYQPELQGKILILDDFAERNSILDRWFTTLYLAGSLKKVSGIAFGGFPNCGPRGSDNMLSIEDTFGDRLNEIGTAACFGFRFGLSRCNDVMPIGIRADLDCDSGVLSYTEAALS